LPQLNTQFVEFVKQGFDDGYVVAVLLEHFQDIVKSDVAALVGPDYEFLDHVLTSAC
jgi:hypothetical protein